MINFNKYPDNSARENIIYLLSNKSPDIRIFCAAKSLCRRNIHQINIGNVRCNPVLFVGALHGMEWLTSLILLKFVETIGDCIENNKSIRGIELGEYLKRRGLIIIPCLNPDGVEISLNGLDSAYLYRNLIFNVSSNDTSKWQANARGVDLNHNFDADWKKLHYLEQSQGICGPSPTRYGGLYPESEPETKFLVSLCYEKNFRCAIAFHSQGEEIYWDFGKHTPAKSKLLAEILATSAMYKVSEPEGLAVGGGFKDWFIQKFCKPGFTVEIGKGQNPLPLSDFDPIYDKIEEMLVLSTVL